MFLKPISTEEYQQYANSFFPKNARQPNEKQEKVEVQKDDAKRKGRKSPPPSESNTKDTKADPEITTTEKKDQGLGMRDTARQAGYSLLQALKENRLDKKDADNLGKRFQDRSVTLDSGYMEFLNLVRGEYAFYQARMAGFKLREFDRKIDESIHLFGAIANACASLTAMSPDHLAPTEEQQWALMGLARIGLHCGSPYNAVEGPLMGYTWSEVGAQKPGFNHRATIANGCIKVMTSNDLTSIPYEAKAGACLLAGLQWVRGQYASNQNMNTGLKYFRNACQFAEVPGLQESRESLLAHYYTACNSMVVRKEAACLDEALELIQPLLKETARQYFSHGLLIQDAFCKAAYWTLEKFHSTYNEQGYAPNTESAQAGVNTTGHRDYINGALSCFEKAAMLGSLEGKLQAARMGLCQWPIVMNDDAHNPVFTAYQSAYNCLDETLKQEMLAKGLSYYKQVLDDPECLEDNRMEALSYLVLHNQFSGEERYGYLRELIQSYNDIGSDSGIRPEITNCLNAFIKSLDESSNTSLSQDELELYVLAGGRIKSAATDTEKLLQAYTMSQGPSFVNSLKDGKAPCEGLTAEQSLLVVLNSRYLLSPDYKREIFHAMREADVFDNLTKKQIKEAIVPFCLKALEDRAVACVHTQKKGAYPEFLKEAKSFYDEITMKDIANKIEALAIIMPLTEVVFKEMKDDQEVKSIYDELLKDLDYIEQKAGTDEGSKAKLSSLRTSLKEAPQQADLRRHQLKCDSLLKEATRAKTLIASAINNRYVWALSERELDHKAAYDQLITLKGAMEGKPYLQEALTDLIPKIEALKVEYQTLLGE